MPLSLPEKYSKFRSELILLNKFNSSESERNFLSVNCNFESTKKADYLLEMPCPGVFCDYKFKPFTSKKR